MKNFNSFFIAGLFGLFACSGPKLDLGNLPNDVEVNIAPSSDYVLPVASGKATISEILTGHEVGEDYLSIQGDKMMIRYVKEDIIDYKFDNLFETDAISLKTAVRDPRKGYPATKHIPAFKANNASAFVKSLFPEQTEVLEFTFPENILEVNKLDFNCLFEFWTENLPLNAQLIVELPEVKTAEGKPVVVEWNCQKGQKNAQKLDLKNVVYTGKSLGSKFKLTFLIKHKLLDNNTPIDIIKGQAMTLHVNAKDLNVNMLDGKTKAYTKDLDPKTFKSDFEFFNEMKGLEFFGSKLALEVKSKSLIGQVKFSPKIMLAKEPLALQEKMLDFNKYETAEDMLKYEGQDIEKLLKSFLGNETKVAGKVVLNPKSSRIAFGLDTEIKGDLVFEQAFDFKLKDYVIEMNNEDIDFGILENFQDSFDNCSLLIHSESNLPLSLHLDGIELMDEDMNPINYVIPIKGMIEGAKDGSIRESKLVVKITKKDIDKLIEVEKGGLQIKAHLSSTDGARVQLKPSQVINLKAVLGINHQF